MACANINLRDSESGAVLLILSKGSGGNLVHEVQRMTYSICAAGDVSTTYIMHGCILLAAAGQTSLHNALDGCSLSYDRCCTSTGMLRGEGF